VVKARALEPHVAKMEAILFEDNKSMLSVDAIKKVPCNYYHIRICKGDIQTKIIRVE
jgi:hypothetical protein